MGGQYIGGTQNYLQFQIAKYILPTVPTYLNEQKNFYYELGSDPADPTRAGQVLAVPGKLDFLPTTVIEFLHVMRFADRFEFMTMIRTSFDMAGDNPFAFPGGASSAVRLLMLFNELAMKVRATLDDPWDTPIAREYDKYVDEAGLVAARCGRSCYMDDFVRTSFVDDDSVCVCRKTVAQVMDEFLADPWFHQPKITDSMRLETRGAMVLAIRSAFSEEPENMSAFFFLLYVGLSHTDAFVFFAC